MHSFIYEITQDAVHPNDWADESNFYDDANVDYTTLLTGQERTNALEELYDYHWFRSLFYRGKEPDTIVYNGNIEAVKNEWYQALQKELQLFIEERHCNTYRLREAIDYPFAKYILFCLSDWAGNMTCKPRVLLELLEDMKVGTVLHINSVLDYHL